MDIIIWAMLPSVGHIGRFQAAHTNEDDQQQQQGSDKDLNKPRIPAYKNMHPIDHSEDGRNQCDRKT